MSSRCIIKNIAWDFNSDIRWFWRLFSKNTHCLYFLGSSSKLDVADAVTTDRQADRVRDFVQLREKKKR